MKTCPRCHIQYPEDKKFCKKCGELLVLDYSTESSKIKSEINPIKQITVKETVLANSNSKKIILKAISIGVSVIVVALIAIFMIFCLGIRHKAFPNL